MLKLKLFCKLHHCIVVLLYHCKQKSCNDIENWKGVSVVMCIVPAPEHGGCQEVLRLGVDAHHARVAVGNSLAIRVFQERFPFFKYCRAKSKSSLLV